MDTIRPNFWKLYPLTELNHAEWEALCDGCGICCLVKLRDEDTNEVEYTNLSCQLLDCKTAKCSNYNYRHNIVPDCITLTYELLQQIDWLPQTCAYKRLNEGKSLPKWHHLITNNPKSVREARVSIAGRCISEVGIPEDDQDLFIVRWIK